ncbi:MAG: ABC transporter ATP-binding protein, partial [Tidjanibacter sp.]|nr:ABC transporter ATP-binding protein [Tidjanibacter sp.]
MKTYWRLLGFAKPLEKYAIPYFFYTLFYALFNLMNFMLIIPILSTLFGGEAAMAPVREMPPLEFSTAWLEGSIRYLIYVVYGESYEILDVLTMLAAIIATSALLSNTFRYLGQRTVENMKIRALQRLRNQTYNNVMRLNVGYFTNERKGDIVSRIMADVQVVRFCITNTLQVAFREPFLILSYFVGMVAISWKLTIFTLIYLPIVGLIIGRIVKKLRKPALTAQEQFGELTSVLDESIAGVKIVKGYGGEEFFGDRFARINKAYSDVSRKMMYRQQLASPMSEFLGILAAAGLMVAGGLLVVGGSLDASGFLAYIGIFSQVTRPIRQFTDAFANINQGIAAGERVLSLLDSRSPITEKRDAIALTEFKESIELRNVSFAYEEREVLSGVSFTIRKGETVALVGPSGGGKSTISDLIPRFYDVTAGEILIDGRNIKDYTLDSLRDKFGMVSQETILFNDTIENNILLGNLDASHEEVVAAARVANADGFIGETPEGYNTNIGDRGSKLSGGQRQRLSIARAVLKNPDILILDEATSALDTESEQLVQTALDKLQSGRTSIVIAHRLSTIHNADRIVVIDAGRVAEQGTHDELIAKGGIYAKLIEMQQHRQKGIRRNRKSKRSNGYDHGNERHRKNRRIKPGQSGSYR